MATFTAFTGNPPGRTTGITITFGGSTGDDAVYGGRVQSINAGQVELAAQVGIPGVPGAYVARLSGSFTWSNYGPVVSVAGTVRSVSYYAPQGDWLFSIDGFSASFTQLRNYSLGRLFSESDRFFGSPLADILHAGEGADTIRAGAGDDSVSGDSGSDTIQGDAGADSLLGYSGDDTLDGGSGADTLLGHGDNDSLDGGAGADILSGGDGYDVLSYRTSTAAISINLAAGIGWSGDAAGDVLTSIETVFGSRYADFIVGSDDHNIIEGGAGADTIVGLGGNDWVSYEFAAAPIAINTAGTGWAGDATGDVVTGIENIRGSAFGDYLFGDDGANILRGDGGADVLYGAGNSDTIYYSTSNAAVRVDLSTNSASGGDAEGDTLVSVENVFGSAYGDRLIGDSASNTLVGWNGWDTLTGNGGNDIFRFAETGGAADVVTDFWREHGDLIDVSGYGADAFTFIGTARYTGRMQLWYSFSGGFTDISLTLDGYSLHNPIRLVGTIELLASDFIL